MSEKQEKQGKKFETALTSVNNTFFPLIERQLNGNGIKMDDYAKQCVIAAISAIHTVLDSKGLSWKDNQLDHSNITQTLLSVASLKLNAAASPREVYFQLRNVKVKVNGQDVWKKKIEMGIEGDGNDAILARFGRDVKKVNQFWLVRENDQFEYPKYNGLEFEPPKWVPSGKGNVIRVVYPIIKNDNTVEYYIAERDDVAKNLVAHINNNMMNETFGICESRYKATNEQLEKINARKKELLKKAQELGLDALDDPELQKWISPAWMDYHSREQMIIRKMRNNIVKKIPKDFGNAYIEMTYHEQTDEALKNVNREIEQNANSEYIDVDVDGETSEPGESATTNGDEAEKEKANGQQSEQVKQEPEPKSEPDPEPDPEPKQSNSPTGTEGPGF